MQNRFSDENKRLSDFHKEVLVCCPACGKKAIARVNDEESKARLLCAVCGYNKEIGAETTVGGKVGRLRMAADHYFDAPLFMQHPFKNDVFYAYNEAHLDYLERYIGATLREHTDRTHFTLLEKLPKFYHEAKNRGELLRVIGKLRKLVEG